MYSLMSFEGLVLCLFCICKSLSQDSVFQPFENSCFENFSSGSTVVSPIANSGYERMSSTHSMNSTPKIGKIFGVIALL